LGTLGETVYHLELRHFPRNLCRFNLSEQELRVAVLEPWAVDRPFELGDLRWDPRNAKLTVLEGPRIPPERLSMGRGWRTAQREGQDVTERLLAAVRDTVTAGVEGQAFAGGTQMAETAHTEYPGVHTAAASDASGAEGAAAAPSTPAAAQTASGSDVAGRTADLAADSLGLELLAQIGSEQLPLRRAWELAATRDPDARASDALALAERAVASLLRARLIVLLRAAEPEITPQQLGDGDTGSILRAPESWSGGGSAPVWMRRA
jgi:hypothetical protein